MAFTNRKVARAVAASFSAAACFTLVAPDSYAKDDKKHMRSLGDLFRAHHAASKCLNPDPASLALFHNHLRTIYVYAFEEYSRRNPRYSEKQVAAIISYGSHQIGLEIGKLVESSGCADAKIQRWIAVFNDRSTAPARHMPVPRGPGAKVSLPNFGD